ncbi:MAG: LssY C-terminal domain-containing protein [Elusimicrobia bacterium]|nr:LssY C-terminal domain-containing protein [Elusimicrobiota bacterium]
MRRPAALGAFLLAAALAAAFFWDVLFPLGAMPPSPRTIERGGIPAVLRILPGRNAGRGGRDGDPMNLAFWGTEAEVRRALEAAGWTEVPLRLSPSLRAGLGEVLRGERLRRFPPFNAYLLLGRQQDMNWAIVVKPLASRHHFRLWRTGFAGREGRELWWGSGNRDLSIRWRDLSHRPDPDMDSERDFLAETLEGSPFVGKTALVSLLQVPKVGNNDKGYAFRTDGRVLLVELDGPGTRAPAPGPPRARDRKARR